MAADLRSNTMFSRISLVVMDDCLIKLEHGRTGDRVRKFTYDSIESIVIWRKTPWVRIVVCTTFLALPGAALQFVGDTFATYSGLFLLALGLGLVAWYLICRSTTIRIMRGGIIYDVVGIFRPGRVRKLRDNVLARIRAVQTS
ncbi:MAG TPA: hypothetical protein VGN72_17370 [Tepidisphaeraceae bacterium]|jgi:hypothetical protein|nr:hypothetical protein [Tepidisphaeraceae bacterium]